ncbi:unnamed protein product [Gongylonema pulchrum]|uniref:C-type lectin domain-containing protein n=1 Tax=Gongylonema pulchrum TaxID=637853 RepID=A0A183CV52_9BILA|nr:unnamed protein product [Gongylonema pulchrum]
MVAALQMWIVAHYPPANPAMWPERTVHIGLHLVERKNSTDQEWRWLENKNKPQLGNFLELREWEAILKTNETKEAEPEERGRCAVLSIDNLVLRAVKCHELVNRFICERNESQHHEVCCY